MKLKGIALITLAFFAPISIFITDLAIFSLVILWLFEGHFRLKWNIIKSSPWILSLLALLLLYVVGMLWGTNHQGAEWLFQKSILLLLLPILYTFNFSHKEVKVFFICLSFSDNTICSHCQFDKFRLDKTSIQIFLYFCQ